MYVILQYFTGSFTRDPKTTQSKIKFFSAKIQFTRIGTFHSPQDIPSPTDIKHYPMGSPAPPKLSSIQNHRQLRLIDQHGMSYFKFRTNLSKKKKNKANSLNQISPRSISTTLCSPVRGGGGVGRSARTNQAKDHTRARTNHLSENRINHH